MEFRILGPLEVSENGVEVTVLGRSTKRLLALLLLYGGRALPMSRLIDGLWEDAPPTTAKRQVQNHAAALRRYLGAGRITSAGDGYRFNVDNAWLDSMVFAEAVKASRELAETGQTGEALTALRSGLNLWRGHPLTGMSGRAIDSGVARLEELRLSAVEDKVNLELSTGVTEPVVTELRQVLADHPHRQRATAQLILALHRNGRTVEALKVFEATRAKLAEDLGLDPGEALCELNAAVLRNDPSLSTSTDPALLGTALAPRGPVPKQLPTDPARFVGRADAMAALNKHLAEPRSTRTCVIAGAAGSGKTALAVRWAYRAQSKFPDGQLFINLRGFDPGDTVSTADALGRFLRALQPPETPVPADFDEALALYRSLTSDKRLLVVLDNAADENQVQPLLPAGSGNFAIVTSRNRLTGLTDTDSAATLSLAALSTAEAIDVLAEVVGSDRLDADPESTRNIVHRCDRLPLALRIAAALLANDPAMTPTQLADELDSSSRLELLSIDGDPHATIAVALDHSFVALHPDARRLLCLLGLIPGDDFSRELAVTIHNPSSTERPLDHLESMHLVEQHQPDRFRLHDLVRGFVAQRAPVTLTDSDRHAVADRFIEWHQGFGRESRPEEEANVLDACRKLQSHPELWRLIGTLSQAASAGRVHAGLKDAIGAIYTGADVRDDTLGKYHALGALLGYYLALGDRTTAIETAHRAVAIAEQLGTQILARATRNLGMAWYAAGKLVEAETHSRQALDLTQDPTDWHELFDSWFNLSNICRCLGKYAEVEELLNQMAALLADRDSPQRSIWLSYGRTTLYLATGNFDRALTAVNDVLARSETQSEPRWEALGRINRGEHHRRVGRFAESETDLLRALELARRIQNRVIECDVLRELVMLSVESGEHHQAMRYADELTTDGLTGQAEPYDQAGVELALSVMHTALGDHLAGAEHAERAVELFKLGPHVLELGRSHHALADALGRLGRHDAARENQQKAQEIFTDLGVT